MKKHHILVPVDFSKVTDEQINYTVSNIQEPAKTRVSILHAVQPYPPMYFDDTYILAVEEPNITPYVEKTTALAKELSDQLPGVEVNPKVVLGRAYFMMRKFLLEGEIDEVVIGSHGHGALFDLVFGSVTATTIKYADCPVHILPAQGGATTNSNETILAFVDLSENSVDVLKAALRVAQRSGKAVRAVYAEDTSSTFAMTGYSDLYKFQQLRRGSLSALLRKIQEEAVEEVAGTCEFAVRIGPPIEMLQLEIKLLNPALVVIGAHRNGAFHDLVVGSVSRAILKKIELPVLVVNTDSSEGQPKAHTEAEENASLLAP